MNQIMMQKTLIFFLLLFFQEICAQQYDVVIYGGTSAGVIASVQAAKMGTTRCPHRT